MGDFMEVFARRLRQLRMDAGEKQTDLQAALHCSQGMVSSYENGREPPYDLLVQIAQHYDVTADYLLGLSASKQAGSGLLMNTINRSAAASEASGVAPISAEDLQQLLQQLQAYAAGAQTAGTLPIKTAYQLITGMTALLAAMNSGSASAVIDANNELLSAVLSVSNITTAHLNAAKEDNT